MTRVRLVGTAHVSTRSATRVREAVAAERPAVVAVELDDRRYRRLLAGDPPSVLAVLGMRGEMSRRATTLYVLLALSQRRAARRLGVSPGVDMRAGIEAAADVGASVALIDRETDETMNRLASATLSAEALRGAFRRLSSSTGRRDFRAATERLGAVAESIGLDEASATAEQVRILETLPYEELERLLGAIAEAFPGPYEVMVESRDRTMAEELARLAREEGDVVAVVGRAHVPGIRRELERIE